MVAIDKCCTLRLKLPVERPRHTTFGICSKFLSDLVHQLWCEFLTWVTGQEVAFGVELFKAGEVLTSQPIDLTSFEVRSELLEPHSMDKILNFFP